ncbi:hypothetical protein IX38_13225 [Chryseobacterium luteum]|uniref:Uncharacterized protein n=1 Tax=Chryseobacterium luteum TaxID=421531 RepID=A0A085ZDP4_9FLAO|nr:hypothetical protein IX38_13225 [Chryseobacterium luteum]
MSGERRDIFKAFQSYIKNSKLIAQQTLARATRDYYDLMLVGVGCIILILLLLPQIQKVVLRLRKYTLLEWIGCSIIE